MRKIFTVIALLSLGSCLTEDKATPGKATTFIRYFNGGNNDTAQAMEITSDGGFIILATTKIQKTEADIPSYKIKLIKTDASGNAIWQSFFPAIDDTSGKNYTASNLQIVSSGGYVVTGEDIQKDSTAVLVLTIDDSGAIKGKPASLGPAASGKAVAVNSVGDFLVLSSNGTDNMHLAEVDKNNISTVKWTKEYNAGATTLANKLFIDENSKILWSGVATKSGLTGIRMMKTAPDSQNTDFDLLISNPPFSEVATDFCRFGYDYAIIGSTNQKPSGTSPASDTDILFKRLGADGNVLSTMSFPFDNQNDVGNSISSTSDGGLILLSSVNSAAINGRGDTDYYLIKINAFGDKVWTSSFGSRYKDDGVTVRQTSDGGYAVLGTTTQGALKLLTLTKTDNKGMIQ